MSDYTTLAEVRALDGLSDTDVFPDATLQAGIDFAEELIDNYTGTSWVAKTFTITISGRGARLILLRTDEGRPVLYPKTLTSVTIDGTLVADTSAWGLHPEGTLIRDSGVFTCSTVGRNVVIVGTAGLTTVAPEDIAWCARTIAGQWAIDLVSRVPDRALSVQNEFGTVAIAQASAHSDRPTSLPEVNARLVRRRQI